MTDDRRLYTFKIFVLGHQGFNNGIFSVKLEVEQEPRVFKKRGILEGSHQKWYGEHRMLPTKA